MTDKIISITGEPLDAPREVNQAALSTLQDAIHCVEAGDAHGVIAIMPTHDGSVITVRGGHIHMIRTVGALHAAATRLTVEIDEDE